MEIGKYKLKIITSGYFGLDGGAMFGVVPKPLWQKTNPSDERNRIKLSATHLILESDSRKIIIDTGMGNKMDEKFRQIYDVDENNSMDYALKQIGYSCDDITDVFLTHLHFDHTGGSTMIENGKVVPAFPNAKYYVQKKQYDWTINPSDKDKASYIKDNYVPLLDEGVLKFTSGDERFDDEIQFIETNGHTFGQQLINVSDSSNTLLFCADLIPTISHIPLPYIMGYDLQPMETLKEKTNILPLAAEENWILFFGHDPEVAFCTLINTEKGIRADKKYKSFDELT
jgi:glyoxylase-like metal-dependent hydrolase (beta-lactamase superfamily II)